MRELWEELLAGRPVREVLEHHRRDAVRAAVILVVLAGALLAFLCHENGDIQITEHAAEIGRQAEETEGAASSNLPSEDDKGQLPSAAGQASSDAADATGMIDTDGIIYVDVGGAVKTPLLAELPIGSRVEDAIQAAGGVTKEADLSTVNRAQVLSDGEKVYIPREGEMQAPGSTTDQMPAGSGAQAASAADAAGKVNINTADLTQLQQLTGVGPVTAQKIIDYRSQNGSFHSVEDLKNVSGIGEKTFEKMKDDVTI